MYFKGLFWEKLTYLGDTYTEKQICVNVRIVKTGRGLKVHAIVDVSPHCMFVCIYYRIQIK